MTTQGSMWETQVMSRTARAATAACPGRGDRMPLACPSCNEHAAAYLACTHHKNCIFSLFSVHTSAREPFWAAICSIWGSTPSTAVVP
jgi:hypothetical protein